MADNPPRRFLVAWLPWVALALGIGTLAYFNARPRLSEQERQLVGVWVGLDTRNPAEPYVWRTELKEDRTLRILFKHFRRGLPLAPGDGPPHTAWQWTSEPLVEERGRWRVVNGLYIVDSWHTGSRPGFRDKLEYFMVTHDWPPDATFHEEYVVELVDDRVFRKRGTPSGNLFISYRGSPLTELPAQPLPPEQWAK